jgi:hypothetical protein
MIPFLGEHILKILAPVYWTLVQYRESASVSLRVSIRRLEGSGIRDQESGTARDLRMRSEKSLVFPAASAASLM